MARTEKPEAKRLDEKCC